MKELKIVIEQKGRVKDIVLASSEKAKGLIDISVDKKVIDDNNEQC